MKKIDIFDSTLRDGAQGEGVSFSVEDKLAIARALDRAGVDYIEAGNPHSNPKDEEFFRRAAGELRLSHARLVAFGSTRRRDSSAGEDKNVAALLETGDGLRRGFRQGERMGRPARCSAPRRRKTSG